MATQPLPPELTAASEQVHVIEVSAHTTIVVERRPVALPIRMTTMVGGSGMIATMSRETAIELRSALTEVLGGNPVVLDDHWVCLQHGRKACARCAVVTERTIEQPDSDEPHRHRASCHGAIGELQCGYR